LLLNQSKTELVKLFALALISASLWVVAPNAQAKAIEDYGHLPSIRSVVISPQGSRYALIINTGRDEILKIASIDENRTIGSAKLGKLRASELVFVNEDTVLLKTFDTKQAVGYQGRYRDSTTFSYDIPSDKVTTLLNGTSRLYPVQSGLGKIVAYNKAEDVFYMPAYTTANRESTNKGGRNSVQIQGANPSYDLYKVSAKTGKGFIYQQGNSNTIDWFVSDSGEVLAREDYLNKAHSHRIYSYLNDKNTRVYEVNSNTLESTFNLVGSDEKSLLFGASDGIKKLSLVDGRISDTSLDKDQNDIDYFHLDLNRKLLGISYSGLLPYTVMRDEKLDRAINRVQSMFKGSRVTFESASSDANKVVMLISGNEAAGSYMIYDQQRNSLTQVGQEYPNIKRSDIGPITTVSYTARDGLKIPSLITWPPHIEAAHRAKLPLLVFPHGGPESYDGIGFDWWAQYFANKGYAILQPNFRGSSGFGSEHIEKGRGEWGKSMQDDVNDGVLALIETGQIDAERVCIMGASYGGYSALAGGAFSPELYRCIISFAGISSLPRMLNKASKKHGQHHWINRYWGEKTGKDRGRNLADISPINYVDQFKAPILLLHGKHDTVVDIEQSKIMYTALKKAKKDVRYVQLKGEDHWLTTSATRLELLQAIDEFLGVHNPI